MPNSSLFSQFTFNSRGSMCEMGLSGTVHTHQSTSAFSLLPVYTQIFQTAQITSFMLKQASGSENDVQPLIRFYVFMWWSYTEFCTSSCCCSLNNNLTIWPMPSISFSNQHSDLVMALAASLSWDWSVKSWVCFYSFLLSYFFPMLSAAILTGSLTCHRCPTASEEDDEWL